MYKLTFMSYGRYVFHIDISEKDLGQVLTLADMLWDDIIKHNGKDFNMTMDFRQIF